MTQAKVNKLVLANKGKFETGTTVYIDPKMLFFSFDKIGIRSKERKAPQTTSKDYIEKKGPDIIFIFRGFNFFCTI